MKFIDLTKKPPFGLLTVISHSHRGKDYKHYWNCLCQCGKEKTIRGNYLTEGRVVSCGCRKKRRGKDHPGWKGCGDLSGQHINGIRANAKCRDIPYKVSVDYLWNLFVKQNKRCALTGKLLSMDKDSERTASLDRINSTKGYVKGNVQWVHKVINLMKMDLSEPDFLKWCQTVVEHTK